MTALTALAFFLCGVVAGGALFAWVTRTTNATAAAVHDIVAPIRDGLERYDQKLHDIELDRVESFAALGERLDLMSHLNDVLRGETASLARALTSSNVRGAWGELQLKRAVELAGMLEHCDFDTQVSSGGDDTRQRPDMVITLPGGRTIVVDAKTPAAAILQAVNAPDPDERDRLCREHVAGVRRHVDALSRKSYWSQFPEAPEFVVMFLPSEAFFSVALEYDHSLFEHSFEQKVIIATPTTLVAMLKAIAFGWRQENVARNAQEISTLGRELYDRIGALAGHFEQLGSHLGRAVRSYNRTVGTLERRVLPSARRFEQYGVGGTGELGNLRPLDHLPQTTGADDSSLVTAPDA